MGTKDTADKGHGEDRTHATSHTHTPTRGSETTAPPVQQAHPHAAPQQQPHAQPQAEQQAPPPGASKAEQREYVERQLTSIRGLEQYADVQKNLEKQLAALDQA